MSFALSISLVAVGLFAAMLLVLELGRRIGTRRLAALPPGTSWEIGTLDGAVFALLGLLIAFTFSGAVTRFEARKHLVVEETNAIGTAYLRLDSYPSRRSPPCATRSGGISTHGSRSTARCPTSWRRSRPWPGASRYRERSGAAPSPPAAPTRRPARRPSS